MYALRKHMRKYTLKQICNLTQICLSHIYIPIHTFHAYPCTSIYIHRHYQKIILWIMCNPLHRHLYTGTPSPKQTHMHLPTHIHIHVYIHHTCTLTYTNAHILHTNIHTHANFTCRHSCTLKHAHHTHFFQTWSVYTQKNELWGHRLKTYNFQKMSQNLK